MTINLEALFRSKKFLESISCDNLRKIDNIDNKICVVVFANSKSKGLTSLLKTLNNQTYDKQNYSCHVIFAKDSNSIINTPDCMSGAQIHCIENPEFFKKNKALNTFIEKLLIDSKFNAYIFLGADRQVAKNYLENVNLAVNKHKSAVLVGKTVVVSAEEKNNLKSKVFEARQKFKNNTENIARRIFDLATVIDSDNCVITSDILEKTGRVCFETKEDELKYSLFLASNDIKPIYTPSIETFVDSESYNPVTAGLSVRLALFKYYLKLLVNKPWHFIEFTLSLVAPNVAVVVLLYFILFYTSFKFVSSIGINYIVALGWFYLFVWGIGLIASRLTPVKTLFFLLYPFYSFGLNFRKLTKDVSRRALQRTITEEKNIKSATMDAVVTDGTKDVMCKMDLISEDGMRRVILRFRKKRVISDESIRMFDAVQNISKRIKTHGYTLKICQNCKNFKITQDGTVDLLKGECLINSTAQNKDGAFETLIWNTCDCFNPKPITNVIDNLKNNQEER